MSARTIKRRADFSGDAGRCVVTVFAFVLLMTVWSITFNNASGDRVIFQIILFSICVCTSLLARQNARLRLLAFIMPMYYIIFGASEFISFIVPTKYILFESSKAVPKTLVGDLIIIIGAISMLAGALLTNILGRHSGRGWFRSEWSEKAIFRVAVFSWLVGFVALVVVQIVYESLGKTIGIFSHLISNLSYLSILGGMMMIYLSLTEKSRLIYWIALISIMIGEYVLGFIGNTKEISYRLPILFVLSGFMLHGRIHTKVVAILILSFIPYQALFSIYRKNVIQVKDQTTLEAIASRDKAAAAVKEAAGKEESLFVKSALVAVERVDCRKYIDILALGVGKKVEYLDGKSIVPLFYSLVPRAMWRDKPEIHIGQLFNWEFGISASRRTFVPTTQVGELYWNFGFAGVVWGMLLIGVIVGVVGRACALEPNATVGKFLVLMVSAYLVGLRFEDGITPVYSRLIRIIIIIVMSHFVVLALGGRVHKKAPEAKRVLFHDPFSETTSVR